MENKEVVKQEIAVSYDSAYGLVNLTKEDVVSYLARGNGKITDKEIKLFVELCKAQQLNPFVNEAYLVKFGDQPAQVLVGYDAYKRRAFENPNFVSKTSGIIVLRGSEIIKKEGACVYPSETLVGGWCRTEVLLHGSVVPFYKEVSLQEYDKKQALWKDKPAMMIEKVAISQCLREAFPREFEGVYSSAEAEIPNEKPIYTSTEETVSEVEILADKDKRWELVNAYKNVYGEDFQTKLKEDIAQYGTDTTASLTVKQVDTLISTLPLEG